MKKIRLFANRDRIGRTRIVYMLLTAGTVIAAFLFVLINQWIFRLAEANLYDRTEYEAVSIISADSIGAPLSTETRVNLFRRCTREGDERAVMPGELSAAAIRERLEELWHDTLETHAANGMLHSGESVSKILRQSRYETTLRDFLDDSTGAKLALWCAQAYITSADGQTYCLSVQFDSRTGEVFSETCALFSNVRESEATQALIPFLQANGYSETLAESSVPISTSYGCRGTLALPDGLVIAVTYASGVQYEITFR